MPPNESGASGLEEGCREKEVSADKQDDILKFVDQEQLKKLDPRFLENLKQDMKNLKQTQDTKLKKIISLEDPRQRMKKNQDENNADGKQNLGAKEQPAAGPRMDQGPEQKCPEELSKKADADARKVLSFSIDVENLDQQKTGNTVQYQLITEGKVMVNQDQHMKDNKLAKIMSSSSSEAADQRAPRMEVEDPDAKGPSGAQSRYWLENGRLTCHRCGKSGHVERQCLQEMKNTCMHCLLSHQQFEVCNGIICFYCN